MRRIISWAKFEQNHRADCCKLLDWAFEASFLERQTLAAESQTWSSAARYRGRLNELAVLGLVDKRPGKSAGEQQHAEREAEEDEKRGQLRDDQHGGHCPVESTFEQVVRHRQGIAYLGRLSPEMEQPGSSGPIFDSIQARKPLSKRKCIRGK